MQQDSTECLFCTIAKSGNYIAENSFCYALYDEFPVSPGHALIIPKEHIESFFNLNESDVTKIHSLLRITRDMIEEKFGPDGFNIGINEGEAAGRTVHHLHIHLIPRYRGDVPEPKGGIRHVIPGKGFYNK